MDHKFFVGIDLGTTNSVIAWRRQDQGENSMRPRVIETPMLTTDGTVEKKELLPSCVYFREDDTPIVGEYARDLIGNESGRVVRAVKLEMDKKEQKRPDGVPYKPVDVSALILGQLKAGAEQILFRNMDFPEDVAIAYPASFDQVMKDATEEAANKVGFAHPNLTLVPEPVAVLCDFFNEIRLGIPPERLGDTDKPKLFLVFDLGGGTLDVVLYGVYAKLKDRVLAIDPIAVNRFTRVGGNNFDGSVAESLKEKYLEFLRTQEREILENSNLDTELQLYTEWAKRDLSVQSELWKRYRDEELDPEKIVAEIKIPADKGFFEYDLSLSEYETYVADYLACDLDIEKFNQHEVPKYPKNIIDPIVDVLQKGEKELRERQEELGPIRNISGPFWQNGKFYRGQVETGAILKPDHVLISGGMAKFPLIQKRLEGFFGFPPDELEDPDVAVARGAVACLTWNINL